jgi:hypothetical protein
LLGSRPSLKLETENKEESCATISYRCLAIGGLDDLLQPWDRTVSSRIILTPALLTDYAEIARSIELEHHISVKEFQKEFELESIALDNQFNEKIRKIKESKAEEKEEIVVLGQNIKLKP